MLSPKKKRGFIRFRLKNPGEAFNNRKPLEARKKHQKIDKKYSNFELCLSKSDTMVNLVILSS
jgi:hypothetical protein